MERCTTLIYRGKTIHLFNYEGLRGADLLETVRAATQIMLKAEAGRLLVLTNFTNTYLDDQIMGYLTGAESRAASHHAHKIAVVGVTGLKKLFFNMYNAVTVTQAKAFDTVGAAKDYLVA
jgi:hypothetical protein